MKNENVAAAVKRMKNRYDLLYTRERGYEQGFFKKMVKAGKDELEKFVKKWTNEMSGNFHNDNKTLQIIHEYTVEFFETALKCKEYSQGVFPASGDGGFYLLVYYLDKEESVFKFDILKRK